MIGHVRRASLALVCAFVIAGCGSTTVVTRTVVTRTVTTQQAAPPPGARSAVPVSASARDAFTLPVHDLHGNTLSVRADGLIDPATPANPIFAPGAGKRLVALVLTLTSDGPQSISDDANTDVTVIGTDDQAYTPGFGAVDECTNFHAGGFALLPHDSERGCVMVALPDGVNVQSAQFSLGNGTAQFNNQS